MSTTCKVKAGDTLELIARRYFGDAEKSGLIERANPGLDLPLREGVTLFIPNTKGPLLSILAGSGDDVALSIDGVRFSAWTDVRIQRSVDAVTSVSFISPFDTENPQAVRKLRPFSYSAAALSIGGRLFFNGVLMNVQPYVTDKSSTITATCYSAAGVLNDVTPPPSDFPVQYEGLNLRQIAERIAEPFGVGVVLNGDPGDSFDRVQLSPGQTCYDFLSKLSTQRGRTIRDDAQGNLVFYRADALSEPVAALKENAPPVISVAPQFDPQSYYSHITGLEAMVVGLPGGEFTVKNPSLSSQLRPFVFNVPDSVNAGVKAATEDKASRMLGAAAQWRVSVAEWRDENGQLWEPGAVVDLEAPSAMVYRRYTFLIKSVTFITSSRQRYAELVLVLPDTYRGTLPGFLPWDL